MKQFWEKHRVACLIGCLIIVTLAALLCSLPGNWSEPEPEKTVPKEMQELANAQSVEWMAGLWAELTNYTRISEDGIPGGDIYLPKDAPISAKITLQNGLETPQPFFFLVLADGAPVEFRLGQEDYWSYPLELSGQTILDLVLEPEFSLGLGRLDFILFYDGNPKSLHSAVAYTVWVGQQENQPSAENLPKSLGETVERRSELREVYSGDSIYDAWLWSGAVLPGAEDVAAPSQVTPAKDGTMLLEAVANGEGIYRTVFILDGKPVEATISGETVPYLDWEASQENMLQVRISLPDPDGGTGYFLTVSTRLDCNQWNPEPISDSRKIQITAG